MSSTGELSPATHYHVGYVVADIEATMESVGRALGVTWAPLRDGNRLSDRTRRVSTPEGARDVRFRVARVQDAGRLVALELAALAGARARDVALGDRPAPLADRFHAAAPAGVVPVKCRLRKRTA